MTRREFVKAGAATGVLLTAPHAFAHSSVDEKIKVGLIGCGGRGTGAAINACEANPNVVVWAMGDIFKDKLEGSQNWMKGEIKEKYQVTPERTFLGFDSYKKVLAQDVDVIILATPPVFRPEHFEATINAGKHVFFEKPIAVDVAGCKRVIAASEVAKQKGLGVAAGTQRRHDLGYRATMEEIHSGKIGEVVSCCAYWNQGGLWMNPRQEGWSDLEWQLRNWLYFTWISGDHISEQHIHNIDVCLWAKQMLPTKAISLGGRQVRTDAAYGHVYDHFATEYEFPDGTRMHSYCRQQDGTSSRVWEFIRGTKAMSDGGGRFWGGVDWKYEGERPNPYMLEHKHLLDSIKEGKPINEGRQVAESTIVAIMGRAAAYSGQEIKYDEFLASNHSITPEKVDWEMKLTVDPVALPGKSKMW